jgi:Putative auto-transporter adhesin, head GIN domain
MKTATVIFYLLFCIAFANAQITKKTLEFPEIKSIYNNSNYTVYLKQTNKQEVNVEALTEIYQLTSITVENGTLIVNVDRKPDNPNKSVWAKIDDIKLNPTMKIFVSVKNIGEIQVNGGGKVVSENSIASSVLVLSVAGSGSMDLDIKGDIVKTEISGSGKIALRGYATTCDVLVSGNGSINAYDCPVENSKVKMSGSGQAELNVTANLDAVVIGSGVIKHKGNTKNTTKKIYGSGSVDRAY